MSTKNEGIDFLRVERNEMCHPRFLNPETQKIEE